MKFKVFPVGKVTPAAERDFRPDEWLEAHQATNGMWYIGVCGPNEPSPGRIIGGLARELVDRSEGPIT